MEPTTVILILGLAAPATATTLRTLASRQEPIVATKFEQPATVSLPVAFDLAAVSTQFELPVAKSSTTPLQAAIERISALGAPGSLDAISFLERLPSGFPIPNAVHGEDDVVSLFWDTSGFYADIDFTGDGHLSVFTRERGEKTIDRGEDGIPLNRPFIAWGYNYLSPLAPRLLASA